MIRELPRRKSIRLPEYDYSRQGAYFVTLCSFKKEHVFGEVADGVVHLNDAGRMVVEVWANLPSRFPEVAVDSLVIMPNHVHAILAIAAPVAPEGQDRRRMLLSKAVGYVKMNASKRVNAMLRRIGCPVWQRNYYERIIRDQGELEVVREYIATNPARWADDPER